MSSGESNAPRNLSHSEEKMSSPETWPQRSTTAHASLETSPKGIHWLGPTAASQQAIRANSRRPVAPQGRREEGRGNAGQSQGGSRKRDKMSSKCRGAGVFGTQSGRPLPWTCCDGKVSMGRWGPAVIKRATARQITGVSKRGHACSRLRKGHRAPTSSPSAGAAERREQAEPGEPFLAPGAGPFPAQEAKQARGPDSPSSGTDEDTRRTEAQSPRRRGWPGGGRTAQGRTTVTPSVTDRHLGVRNSIFL